MKQLFALLMLVLASTAHAQYAGRQLPFDARSAPDLKFPDAPTPLADAKSPAMMLIRPDGVGPFPAVVLGHQCGGLIFNKANPNAVNWSMLSWAKTFVERGYVTLLVDFMDQRGAKSLCTQPQNGVTFGRTIKDFYQAAQYLRAQPGVDPDKVALVGFSQGAIVGLLGNSKNVREGYKLGTGFNAFVSFYPLCGFLRNGQGNYAGNAIQDDLERPHLVFTGGQDNETPFADCQKTLPRMAAAGKPVTYQHFEKATHCFDCKSLNGFTKQGHHGTVTYIYDEEITRQASQQMFEFLDASLRISK